MGEMENNDAERATVETVAVGVHSNPGVYALLLGAGVSLKSGVPSAWNITDELCKKLAVCHGETGIDDGTSWYKSKFGKHPTYSALFEQLSTSGVERVGLLRKYFEASKEDAELGLKTPTAAHRAIARLVTRGYIGVIVTTNFDRLLESALAELGVQPIVISTEADADAKPPLVHNSCTIFKIHGDYLDSTFRNTTDELSTYPAHIRRRLKQILTEYGLIVCGWSGVSDAALREALMLNDWRQYASFYWTSRNGRLSAKASEILEARDGYLVPIESADTFFESLDESLEALEHMSEQTNLTEDLARMRAQTYVTNPVKRANFNDLVTGAAERVINRMGDVFKNGPKRTGHGVLDLLTLIEQETAVLRTIAATGCFYDDGLHDELWRRCIQMLLPRRNGYIAESGIELYPALLVAYTIGVTARLRSNDSVTKVLLADTVWQYYSEPDRDLSIATLLYPANVLDEFMRLDLSFKNHLNPGSSYMLPRGHETSGTIWKSVLRYAASELEFKRAYQSFEYLLGAQFVFERGLKSGWAPTGSLISGGRNLDLPRVATATLDTVDQLEAKNETWGPVAAGMFDGSMENCRKTVIAFNAILEKQAAAII